MQNTLLLIIYIHHFISCTNIFYYKDIMPVTSSSCNCVTSQLKIEFVQVIGINNFPVPFAKISLYNNINNAISIYENTYDGPEQKFIYIEINMNNMSTSHISNAPYAIKISKLDNSKFNTAKLFSIYLLNTNI